MDRDEALERVGTGSAVIVLGFIIGSALQYLIKMVLARGLGPEPYGVFVQGLAITQAAATVAVLGLHKSVPRFISYDKGKSGSHDMQASTVTAIRLVIPASLLLGATLFLSAPWFASAVFSESKLVQPLQLFAVSVPLLALFYLIIGFIRGMQNARYKLYLDDLLFSGLELVLIFIFITLGYGLEGAVFAYLIAITVTVAGSYAAYRRLADGPPQERMPVRTLLGFSWPLFIISLLAIAMKWTDVLMLGWLQASAQVGVYEVALSVAGVLPLGLTAINYMFLPVASELYSDGKTASIRSLYRTTTRWVITLILPVFAGILLFPQHIIRLLFGPAYTSGAIPLTILASGYMVFVAVGAANIVLLAAGKIKQYMAGMTAITGVNAILNLLLVPTYGKLGAAAAMTGGLVIGSTVSLLLASRTVNGLPYTREFLPLLPAFVTATGVVYGLKSILTPGLSASVLLGGILVLIYLGLLILLDGLQDDDIHLLTSLVDQI